MSRKILPGLRFSEFDNYDWKKTKLGKLVTEVNEKVGDDTYLLMSVTSGVGLVLQVEKFGREIAGDSYKNYIVIRKYDFAYNKSATKQFPEGYLCMLSEYEAAAIPKSIFTCFRIIDSECYPDFLDYLFHNNYHGHWLRKYIEVGARAHGSLSIDTKYLWMMPIAMPCLREQQKIADCLASVDVLIKAETKKLELLKKYKRGLMQKLFPAKGKTLPEWRFPEFRGSSEWEYRKISDIGEIVTGKTPSTSDTSLWDGDIQFITPTDMTEEKYQLKTQRMVADTPKIRILPQHTILFTCIASIGKMAMSVYPCVTNQQINSVIPKGDYNNEFVYYSLLMKSFLIKSKFFSTTLPIINKTDFSKLLIPVTLNQKEQQKIADVLSETDAVITAQSNKIKNLGRHKKGLMQGLFPSSAEVDE